MILSLFTLPLVGALLNVAQSEHLAPGLMDEQRLRHRSLAKAGKSVKSSASSAAAASACLVNASIAECMAAKEECAAMSSEYVSMKEVYAATTEQCATASESCSGANADCSACESCSDCAMALEAKEECEAMSSEYASMKEACTATTEKCAAASESCSGPIPDCSDCASCAACADMSSQYASMQAECTATTAECAAASAICSGPSPDCSACASCADCPAMHQACATMQAECTTTITGCTAASAICSGPSPDCSACESCATQQDILDALGQVSIDCANCPYCPIDCTECPTDCAQCQPNWVDCPLECNEGGGLKTWFRDANGDGCGDDVFDSVVACSQPVGYVDNTADCMAECENAQTKCFMDEYSEAEGGMVWKEWTVCEYLKTKGITNRNPNCDQDCDPTGPQECTFDDSQEPKLSCTDLVGDDFSNWKIQIASYSLFPWRCGQKVFFLNRVKGTSAQHQNVAQEIGLEQANIFNKGEMLCMSQLIKEYIHRETNNGEPYFPVVLGRNSNTNNNRKRNMRWYSTDGDEPGNDRFWDDAYYGHAVCPFSYTKWVKHPTTNCNPNEGDGTDGSGTYCSDKGYPFYGITKDLVTVLRYEATAPDNLDEPWWETNSNSVSYDSVYQLYLP